MQKFYLITGGSGFLGINMVRYLLKKGHKVRVLDMAKFDYPERKDIEFIRGDIRDARVVEKACLGVEVVIHAAAALPLYSDKDILSTDVDGTRLMLTGASESGVKRFIHISSTAVYGVPDHHPLYEDDDLIGVGTYGQAKILAEKEALQFQAAGEMMVSILRPKSFIGPERLGVFALLYDWADSGKNFPVLGSGNNYYQLLDVEDLCEAIYLCATLPPLKVQGVFNIGAKEFSTMRQDFQAVLDEAGYGKKIIGLPARPIIGLLKVLEYLRLSPLYGWVYETAAVDSYVSIKKAQDELGFSPRYSNKDSLLRNFKWYKTNKDSFAGQSGVSHRVPWKQGILALAKKFF